MNTRDKWNIKHLDRITQLEEPEPNPRLKKLAAYFKEGGTALDIACGLGGNSMFLAQSDYQVEAMDISDVAINYIQEQASKDNLAIQPQVADLTNVNAQNWLNAYNVMVITYYLDRALFPVVKSSIKEGGYFFMETYYQSPETVGQGISEQYKLRSNELLDEFRDWKVLYFEENEQEGWQSIFCQKR
ncbi:2-polyprenyl-3-methyl-5-hydroxy-6-metoxy-1,4-benzoquinol methylase [Neobacillus niacini]|uniref:class I SAM-dependent methyltransferase n=1 Tax=Neobacillus niacini TaxID=86668 RepID=UPI0028631371|nr:methyltransferase domain-containing protein [Neobacillus niacini]MDR7078146.1 2-polyprenyl-3-methyl-5-hydroxy-6-metoxy-1,4-benzoquinol methylase [Neobacillus niacini]